MPQNTEENTGMEEFVMYYAICLLMHVLNVLLNIGLPIVKISVLFSFTIEILD